MTSTRARLLAAAALCVLPLGFDWSGSVRSGYQSLVSQAPIRVFLVAAALGFLLCATRVRTPAMRRVARLAWVSTAAAALLAAGHGSPQILLCPVVALALAGPAVAGDRLRTRGLVNRTRAG